MKKSVVSVECDSSQNVGTLYNDLKNCNRSIQNERKYMKQGRPASKGYPDLLTKKQTLEAQLTALGLQVSQNLGMRLDSATFFLPPSSAFTQCTKKDQEKSTETLSMASTNSK